MASKDPYEEEEKRLKAVFDKVSTPESSQDPNADDGQFWSDKDYEPSDVHSTSSEDTTRASQSTKKYYSFTVW